MKFAHVGIPTAQEKNWSAYLAESKLHITDAEADPFQIEWLKFEAGSPMPEELKDRAHLAYFVDDLAAELAGKTILIEPFSPMSGLKCAFIMHGEVPIELMQKV
ncbi:MAG: hypothetical protein LBQ54_11865 [Planctomycetaceae bacterium]|nr:hypothetical protein [Planctomycetaceae bacterium]